MLPTELLRAAEQALPHFWGLRGTVTYAKRKKICITKKHWYIEASHSYQETRAGYTTVLQN
jgi:hypothetical protein